MSAVDDSTAVAPAAVPASSFPPHQLPTKPARKEAPAHIPNIQLVSIDSATDPLLPAFRQLVRDFLAELGESLDFQGVEEELAALPGKYSRSERGCMYLAVDRSSVPTPTPVGCIGLRRLASDTAEVKRMYVSPPYRGQRVAEQLLNTVIGQAVALGYGKLRLDTLRRLEAANRLYSRTGFYSIPAYNDCPIEGALWFELDLSAQAGKTTEDTTLH